MTETEWTVIVAASDDVVDGQMLRWAKLDETWAANQHYLAYTSVIMGVVEYFAAADVEREDWDGEAPGRSGVFHTISTNDPDALRAEMKDRIQNLIARSKGPNEPLGEPEGAPNTVLGGARGAIARRKTGGI